MQNFQSIDIEILRSIYENRNPVFDSLFKLVSDSAAALAFGIPGILLIVSLFRKNNVLRRKSIIILIAVALSAIVANILKYSINLPRPFEVYPYIEKLSSGGSPTFPSGHTADAFAFAISVILIFRKNYILVLSLIWAILVGYSRMCLGVHFPSDVLAGAIIGGVCGWGCYFINFKKQRKNNQSEKILE
jgi:membrane-associated phospholipid phosphatase